MFIRWKRRKKAVTKPGRRPRRRSQAGDSLYCLLVESNHVNGSPRQKVICYLGSFNEGDRDKVWLRVDFWDFVSTKLDRLPLARRERARIEESIGKVVSRAPLEEAAKFKKERNEYQKQKAQIFQRLDRRTVNRSKFHPSAFILHPRFFNPAKFPRTLSGW
jgi:hypothetical protein